MQIATRNESLRQMGLFKFSQVRAIVTTACCAGVAVSVALIPAHTGLEDAGRVTLGILVFSALMWITEAIPAFATSLLAIGLLIALLGKPGGVFATGPDDWEMFIAPWGSPLIWLFFGGFCLAAGAERTGLDRWLALRTLGMFGKSPAMVLLGVMLVTAVLSMFVSNTATATLMLAVLSPMIIGRSSDDPLPRGLLLGIALAANIGGMGTIIGTPPNAIAAGVLNNAGAPIDFARWMVLAVPPALALLALAWAFLCVRYLRHGAFKSLEDFSLGASALSKVPPLKQAIVVATFSITVALWMTSPLTGLPTTVVSMAPICVLTATAILSAEDIRGMPWDILLLITGGLSLGVAVDQTGLADWVVSKLPTEGVGTWALVIGFGYITLLLSNLMSNTATANIVLPLAVAVFADNARLIAPIALCASVAMCLPISTPPNAIVYGSGRLRSTDLLAAGLLVGLLGPLVIAAWSWLALGWI